MMRLACVGSAGQTSWPKAANVHRGPTHTAMAHEFTRGPGAQTKALRPLNLYRVWYHNVLYNYELEHVPVRHTTRLHVSTWCFGAFEASVSSANACCLRGRGIKGKGKGPPPPKDPPRCQPQQRSQATERAVWAETLIRGNLPSSQVLHLLKHVAIPHTHPLPHTPFQSNRQNPFGTHVQIWTAFPPTFRLDSKKPG